MSKLRNVYLYLVSFVALMMILIGTIYTVQNLTDVLFPTNYYTDPMVYQKTDMTTEEKAAYEQSLVINERNSRIDRQKSVAKSVAVVVVAIPTFVYHWRKIEKEKKEQQVKS